MVCCISVGPRSFCCSACLYDTPLYWVWQAILWSNALLSQGLATFSVSLRGKQGWMWSICNLMIFHLGWRAFSRALGLGELNPRNEGTCVLW